MPAASEEPPTPPQGQISQCEQRVAVVGRCSVFLELALATMEPHQVAHRFIQAFHRLGLDGPQHRDRFIEHARSWRSMALQCGQDVTYGLFTEVCRSFAISPLELESDREVRLDPLSETALADRRRARVREIAAQTLKLLQCDTFKLLDDGASLLGVSLPLPDGYVVASNTVMSELMVSTTEFNLRIRANKMLPVFIGASLVSPDDLDTYIETVMRGLLGSSPQAYTGLVKVCGRDGNVSLYILRCRKVAFPEFGGCKGSITTLERIPQSRYVTDGRYAVGSVPTRTHTSKRPRPLSRRARCKDKHGVYKAPKCGAAGSGISTAVSSTSRGVLSSAANSNTRRPAVDQPTG